MRSISHHGDCELAGAVGSTDSSHCQHKPNTLREE
jgi:hypothetical protein